MKTIYNKNYILLILILIFLAASAITSIFYGIEFTDTGFIEGAAYRIFVGQEIYQDFDYVRPPLTPWLWHFVFYLGGDGLEVIFRFLVVIEKVVTAFFIYKTLRLSHISKWKSCISGLLTFGFLLNYIPSMPWHTTDGLFFVAASIMLFADKKFHLAIIFATLAALCKQSFYPAPFFVIFLLMIEDRKKIISTAVAAFAVTFSIIYAFGYQNFLRATTGSSNFHDLFTQGILPHIYPAKGFLVGLVLFFSVIVIPRLKDRTIIEKIYFSAILIPSLGVVYAFVKNWFFSDNIDYPPLWSGITHAFVMTILVLVLFKFYRQGLNSFKKNNILIASYLFSAAWMSTLSWGPNNYLYGYGFILAATIILFDDEILMNTVTGLSVIAIGILFLLLGRVYFPYRMESPVLVHHEMISDGHYKYIMASPYDISKLDSIKRISEVDGCKDTYPSVPQAALIGRYIPALRADWKMDVEYPSRNLPTEKIIIENCNIFIERDPRVLDWKGKYGSSAIDPDKISQCAVSFDKNFNKISMKQCGIKH